MAAATVASGYPKRDHVQGDVRYIPIKFTALANTNTHEVPGGSSVIVQGFIPISVSTSASVTATVSNQTLTFNVSAGTPDVIGFIVVGAL
jgi:hypothetical protein